MANDLGTLKAKIADDLERGDMTSQIAAAITASIDFYADKPFWFLEGDGTVETVADTDYVAVPTGLRYAPRCDVEIDLGSDIRALRKLSWSEYRRRARIVTTSGEPTHYAYRNGRFYLHPAPQDVYTITAFGFYTEDALTADTGDGSTNAWTDTARDLIAADAVMRIARDVLRDPEREKNAARAAEIAFNDLVRKGNLRKGTGRVRGHL